MNLLFNVLMNYHTEGFFVVFVQVACPPYKVNALRAFCRILDTPIRILKDCVQMMRLELVIILFVEMQR